jgi:chromate transporter
MPCDGACGACETVSAEIAFFDALKVWARIGVLSFGGPAGQIALLHKEIVEERAWIGEKDFLKALNFCMLLPGPEAMQLATYCGWRLHGQRGGLAAGLLFVLPGACLILALSLAYAQFGQMPFVQALFWGIKAAVLAIVLEALIKISKKALHGRRDWVLAILAFIALFVFGLPFALVIAAAALVGFMSGRVETDSVVQAPPAFSATLKTTALWLFIWLVPLVCLNFIFGGAHVFTRLANMFSVLAVVTFGGAYSVLASLGQTVVEQSAWLTPQQMIDGFGLAETTPGPLILVGQFVAFTAAKTVEGNIGAGVFASLIFLWMTFVPCFLWIFACAPWIEYLDSKPRLRGALQAITAAVTGVIANLSLWFALHVVFATAQRLQGPVPIWVPDVQSLDVAALMLSVVLGIVLLNFKAGIPKTLALGLLAGVVWLLVRMSFGTV